MTLEAGHQVLKDDGKLGSKVVEKDAANVNLLKLESDIIGINKKVKHP